ncbi:MAG: MBL fold metallo-hydrolase [Candidatus Saccharimonadaceae bacterium]
MFDIEYKGANCLVITTKGLTIVTDPRLSLVGLKDQPVKERLVVATEDRFVVDDDTAKLVINGPGEYEVGPAALIGRSVVRHIDAPDQGKLSTMYRMEIGDIRLAIVGNIAPNLSEDDLEALGVVDILIIPVGGTGYTLDATNATKLVRKIEPKVIIPVHYEDKGLNYEVPQEGLELFIKEMGVDVEKMPKYKVKAATSIPATMTIVELERSN